MDNKFSKYLNWVGKFLVVLSIVFIGSKLLEYRQQLAEASSSLSMWILIIVLSITYGMFKFIGANGWYYLLLINKTRNLKISRLEAVIVYGKTHIAKYVPGNIFHYTSRHIFAKKYDLSDSYLITTTFIEIGIVISIAILFSLFGLKEIISHLQTYLPAVGKYAPITITFLGLLGIGAVFFLREKFLDIWSKIDFSIFLKVYGYYLLFYTISLLYFLIILNFVSDQSFYSFNDLRFLIGSYSIAWISGFIIPGAPGGIGVREAVFLALLGNLIQGAILLLAILVFRIVTIIGDLNHFLFTLALNKYTSKE